MSKATQKLIVSLIEQVAKRVTPTLEEAAALRAVLERLEGQPENKELFERLNRVRQDMVLRLQDSEKC